MYENELTVVGTAAKAMGTVSAQVYVNAKALTQDVLMKKVVQDSLPSHRNSHR